MRTLCDVYHKEFESADRPVCMEFICSASSIYLSTSLRTVYFVQYVINFR